MRSRRRVSRSNFLMGPVLFALLFLAAAPFCPEAVSRLDTGVAWGAARPGRAAPRGPVPPEPGVYRLREITALQAARIDRERAVLLQPIGGVEPVGPHLPVGAAALLAEDLADAIGREVRRRRPDLIVVILPTLGATPAPAVAYGLMQLHPTALNISSPTFRETLFNATLRLAEGVWRNYFTISYAFSPEQNRRQDEICAFLRDAYGMKAANLSGLALVDSAGLARQAALALKTFGDTLEVKPRLDIHGGAAMTSLLLALRPALVDPVHASLPAVPLGSIEQFPRVAVRPGWPTYVGAPARATAAYGEALLEILADVAAARAVGILEGSAEATGRTPAAWAVEEFDWRDPLRNMHDWEVRKRRLYDAWLKAHDSSPLPAGDGPR